MPTFKQITANRRNSRLSTGPRTESGKLITRMNALKSGIHAESHIIRGESPESLAELAAEYNDEFLPATPRQRDLVDTLVLNEWKIRRLRAVETAICEERFIRVAEDSTDPTDSWDVRRRLNPVAHVFDGNFEKRLENLQRRLHAYERSNTRALRQLRELQSTEEVPSEIGFVPLNTEAPTPEDRAESPSQPQTPSLTPDPRPLTPAFGFVPPISEATHPRTAPTAAPEPLCPSSLTPDPRPLTPAFGSHSV